jgi:hypothetical protein
MKTTTHDDFKRFRGLVLATLVLACWTVPTIANAAELDEAQLYFELNNTDRDLGIHSSIDGEPYVKLEIEDPFGRMVLGIEAQRRLARQGLTQLFFESAEPPFDELSPQAFFNRFPEGIYEIEVVDEDGEEFEVEVFLSQVMAAPVKNVKVNGIPAAASCDSNVLPTVSAPVVIDWDAVTKCHPTIGKKGAVKIEQYQFFVEREGVKLSVELPPTVTEFEVPAEILALGDDFKFEIIARTATGNNTAIETCFLLQ